MGWCSHCDSFSKFWGKECKTINVGVLEILIYVFLEKWCSIYCER